MTSSLHLQYASELLLNIANLFNQPTYSSYNKETTPTIDMYYGGDVPAFVNDYLLNPTIHSLIKQSFSQPEDPNQQVWEAQLSRLFAEMFNILISGGNGVANIGLLIDGKMHRGSAFFRADRLSMSYTIQEIGNTDENETVTQLESDGTKIIANMVRDFVTAVRDEVPFEIVIS